MWPIPDAAREALGAPQSPAEVDFATAVARSLAGQDIGRELTRAEKAVVARGLEARHFTHRAIAFHLGMHEDAIPRLIHGRPAKKGAPA